MAFPLGRVHLQHFPMARVFWVLLYIPGLPLTGFYLKRVNIVEPESSASFVHCLLLSRRFDFVSHSAFQLMREREREPGWELQ